MKLQATWLHEKFAATRKSQMRRAELARRTGLSQDVLWRYETGNRKPNGPSMAVLAHVLKIDPRDFWEVG